MQLGGPEPLELHPDITVVTGLDTPRRDRLVRALAAVARGEPDGYAGLIEAHGYLLDVGTAACEALDLEDAVDVVLSLQELPEGDSGELLDSMEETAAWPEPAGGARAAVDDAQRAVEPAAHAARLAAEAATTARRELAEITHRVERAAADVATADAAVEAAAGAIGGADAHEQTAAAAVAEAQAAVERTAAHEEGAREVEASLAEAQRRLEAARRAVADARHELEKGRGRLDPDAAAALEAARARLATAEARAATAASEETPPPVRDAEATLAELRARAADAGAALAATEDRLAELFAKRGEPGVAVDPEPVRAAVAALDAALMTQASGPPEIQGDLISDPGIAAARAALDVARSELAQAEVRMRPPEFDPDAVEALELAHTEVEEAEERAERPFAGPGAKRRFRQAQEALQAVLDRMGVPSYSAYLMQSSPLYVDPEAHHEVARLRVQAREAEQALIAAEELMIRDLVRAEAEAEAEWHAQAEAAVDQAAAALVAAAGAAGIPVDPSDPTALRHAARDWLHAHAGGTDHTLAAEIDDAESATDAAHAEVQRLGVGIADAEAALEAALRAATAAAAEGAAAAQRQVEEATAGVQRARQRAGAHDDAARHVEEFEGHVYALSAAEDDAAERVAGLERELAAKVASAAGPEAAELDTRVGALEQARKRLAASHAAHEEAAHRAVELREKLASLQGAREEASGQVTTAEAAEVEAVEALRLAQEVASRAEAALLEADAAAHARAASEPRPPSSAGPTTAAVRVAAAELEVYVLARLAAQRSVGRAGSLPLIVDDAFAGFAPEAVQPVLRLFERMAPSVQIVVVSDDPHLSTWASGLGFERAAVIAADTAVAAG